MSLGTILLIVGIFRLLLPSPKFEPTHTNRALSHPAHGVRSASKPEDRRAGRAARS